MSAEDRTPGAGNPLTPPAGSPAVIISGIKYHPPEAEAPPVSAVDDSGRVDEPAATPKKKKAAPRTKKAKSATK